ncbi:universal stress protein [Roseovarius sp. A46]|uniref:universal stress protein n=1 Tax=Roseovarius sp. A46 TaxID=2109331 RepID=UPI00101385FC|nr:universal stress protein [Roseovarius sp. A46]RXV58051.1 universal stress protein [Roseovarius sp. A46]
MYKNILVPIAPDHINDCQDQLAAAQRLLAEDGRIVALSVVEELPSYVGSYFPKEQVQESIERFDKALKAAMPSDRIETHVVSGHPTNTVLTWARKHGVECIVVASHREGLSGLLLGSTAARVVRHAKCSVVVLR